MIDASRRHQFSENVNEKVGGDWVGVQRDWMTTGASGSSRLAPSSANARDDHQLHVRIERGLKASGVVPARVAASLRPRSELLQQGCLPGLGRTC